MLDRLQQFKETANKHGITVDLKASLNDDEQAINQDRELISEYLQYVTQAQKLLQEAEQNNRTMKDIAHKQMFDNKSANQGL